MFAIEEFDLIRQMKTGDSTLFKKWVAVHSPSIERFAIQYGCERDQAARVAEEVFGDFYNNLEKVMDGEQLVYSLYKAAIEKLKLIQPTKFAHKNSFPFEEDEQLHEKIILLDKEQKMAFILSQFHGLDNVGISKVLDLSETTVELATSEAYKRLNEQVTLLENRLDFLGKSYNRIVCSFNIENVFQRPPEKKEPLVKQKKVLPKKALFSWVAGIVILLALITVSVVTGEEYQNSSAEKYVERLKKSFENEVAEKHSEVGLPLPEEKLIDEEIYPEFFDGPAREEFEELIRELEEQITSNEKIYKKEVSRQYDEILSKLELPSEMTDHLFENPLTDNKEKSEEFIERYVEMVFSLQQSYFMTFFDHEQIFEDATIDGEINIEKFLEEMDEYPEDLQNVLEGMVKQNIYPISLKDLAPFYPVHVNNEISKRIRDSLHKDVGGFITLLELEPSMYYEDPAYTVDKLGDYMIEMEETLFAFENSANSFEHLKSVYIYLLHEIIKGSETTSIVDQNGKVKEGYQLVWKKIASMDDKMPSAFILRKIVDEMESSGWKKSKIHQNLDHETLYNIVDGAKQGEINAFIFEESIEQEEIVVSPNDLEFQADVEERYTKFSKSHEFDYLLDVDPLVVIGVYYFANEREDPETMWHLFNHEHIDISLKEYVKGWAKVEPLPKGTETLSVSMGGSSLNGVPYATISYEKGTRIDYLTGMIVDKEYLNLWTIQAIPEDIENP